MRKINKFRVSVALGGVLLFAALVCNIAMLRVQVSQLQTEVNRLDKRLEAIHNTPSEQVRYQRMLAKTVKD